MDRRTFFLQASALTATMLPLASGLASGAAPAKSGTVCGPDKKRHTNVCTVRVTGPLQFFPATKGKSEPISCWIACLQMVFKYYGHTVPAETILHDVYNGNPPKTPWQDLSALSHPVQDDKKKHLSVITEKLSVRASDAAELLAENQPLIIGAFGHPVLLTGMSYTGDRLGGMTIVDATVLDPAPGKGTRIVSSPDWVNVTFITRVAVHKGGSK